MARGHAVSAATRAKISAALRGKKHPHKGHAITAQTRAKIAAAERGKKHPHKGHAETAATRAKISAALKARHRKAPPTHVARKRAGTVVGTAPRSVRSHATSTTARSVRSHAPSTASRALLTVATHTIDTPLDRAGQVIGTVRKQRPIVRHRRPHLLSGGRGYHRRFKTHLHRHRAHRVAKFRVRHMLVRRHVRPLRLS
jgi:hypothetical protein